LPKQFARCLLLFFAFSIAVFFFFFNFFNFQLFLSLIASSEFEEEETLRSQKRLKRGDGPMDGSQQDRELDMGFLDSGVEESDEELFV
jgi:hypothetical protein